MSTVSRIFESQEATSTVHRSDMRAKTTVQYIPRVDPERVDWLLKWIDEHVPVKSGTDRRVRMATWMHLYANYKADAQAAGQKVRHFPKFQFQHFNVLLSLFDASRWVTKHFARCSYRFTSGM